MRENRFGVISEIDSLPGCSQIGVVHGVWLEESKRGYGCGQKAQKSRLRDMKDYFQYDAAMCTVELSNKRNIHILEKNGWKFQFSFKSHKTNHKVAVYAIGLGQELNPVAPPKADGSLSEVYYSDYVHKDDLGKDPLSMVM